MTTYKGIHGLKVQHVTSDSAASQAATGSWSSSGNLNAGRIVTGFGTQTAAIAAGGFDYPPNVNTNAVESYNGTSWTEVNEINSARREIGEAGTQPAGIIFGGIAPSFNSGGDVEWESSFDDLIVNNNWSGTYEYTNYHWFAYLDRKFFFSVFFNRDL